MQTEYELTVFTTNEMPAFCHIEMSLRSEAYHACPIICVNQVVLSYLLLQLEFLLRLNQLCLYDQSEFLLFSQIIVVNILQVFFPQHLDKCFSFRNELHESLCFFDGNIGCSLFIFLSNMMMLHQFFFIYLLYFLLYLLFAFLHVLLPLLLKHMSLFIFLFPCLLQNRSSLSFLFQYLCHLGMHLILDGWKHLLSIISIIQMVDYDSLVGRL